MHGRREGMRPVRILNYGSLNLDYVYSVDHIVRPGETISSSCMNTFCGGKGLNQSIALARAGSRVCHAGMVGPEVCHAGMVGPEVCHAGMVGPDGGILLDVLKENGVDTEHVREVEERTGSAIIQVSADGQNSIVLFGGANQKNEEGLIDEALSGFAAGDWLLLQNEVNLLDRLVERGAATGMRIALNPSPYDEKVEGVDLSFVSLLLINEVEGEQMAGLKEPREIMAFLRGKYPDMGVVLTLGADGALYSGGSGVGGEGALYSDGAGVAGGGGAGIIGHPAFDVTVVDTTAAGDAFTGYFITALCEGQQPHDALRLASLASALAVSRAGAATSIPWREEVDGARLSVVRNYEDKGY